MKNFKHGNYLQHRETGEIIVYSPEHSESEIKENYKGVAMTEHWLSRIVFNPDAKLGRASFVFNSGTKASRVRLENGKWSATICYKLHELQNLFKETTGFDLIITHYDQSFFPPIP